MKVLVIAEHDNQKLKKATRHVMTAATALGNQVDAIVIGFNCSSVVEQAKKMSGIQQVFVANEQAYAHQLAENSAQLLVEISKNYDYILVSSSTFGKNLLPRLSAMLNVAMVGDVIKIVSADTFVRPIYAGNILATVKMHDAIKLLTVRTTAFSEVEIGDNDSVLVMPIDTVINSTSVKFEHEELTHSARPELTAARVIVSGGRGLKSAENFKLLEGIADRLGAAIGASRAAVDAGFVPNDYQVGQTGKVVAPDLYIAIGISGAIQHLAGMKDSRVIVAINSDPEAPIFQLADYALVGDLFKIIPELCAELDKAAT